MLFISCTISSCAQNVTPQTFLIPKNFKGQIILIYDQPCGIDVPLTNGRLVFKIPENGILILKNKHETGIINHEYYLVNESGSQISKLEFLIQQNYNEDYTTTKNPDEPDRNKLGVFLNGSGMAELSNGKTYTFDEMNVNSWEGLKIDKSFMKNDAVIDSTLINCK